MVFIYLFIYLFVCLFFFFLRKQNARRQDYKLVLLKYFSGTKNWVGRAMGNETFYWTANQWKENVIDTYLIKNKK